MSFISYLSLIVLANIFSLNTLTGIFLQGFIAGIIGIISGIMVLVVIKNHEILVVWKILHHRIWKAKVITTGQEKLLN